MYKTNPNYHYNKTKKKLYIRLKSNDGLIYSWYAATLSEFQARPAEGSGAVLFKDFYIKRTQVLSPGMYREVQNPKPCQKLPYYISSRNKHKIRLGWNFMIPKVLVSLKLEFN
jgi:hypothetical protein